MIPLRSLGRLWSGFKKTYNDINPATLTGANDIIIVEDKSGNFRCGPFHVRFGKMGAINPTDKLVEIYINGQQAVNLHMRLGRAGCGYFVDYVESLFSDSDSDLPSAEGFFDSGKPIGRIRSAEDVNGKTLNPHKHPLRVKKPRRDASVSESQSNTEEDVKYYVSSPTSPECLSDSEVGSQSRGMVQMWGILFKKTQPLVIQSQRVFRLVKLLIKRVFTWKIL